jgi:hypothetical protein
MSAAVSIPRDAVRTAQAVRLIVEFEIRHGIRLPCDPAILLSENRRAQIRTVGLEEMSRGNVRHYGELRVYKAKGGHCYYRPCELQAWLEQNFLPTRRAA